MCRSVEEILRQPGLLRRRFSKNVKLADLHGVDPGLFATVPEDALLIAMDQERFVHLQEEERRALIEAGYGICDCSIWSTQALDEASLSDLAPEPAKQNAPLRVTPDYYVITFVADGKTRYLPLRKVLHRGADVR